MSTNNDHAAPSDLDLMLYADGELEGDALAAVEAFLARDASARQKVLAMGMVGDLVRAEADAAHAGDAIADDVMKLIALEPRAAAPASPAKPEPKVAQIVAAKPENDNARSFWVIATIAAAAAAALLFWGRGLTTDPVAGGSTSSVSVTRPAPHDPALKVEAPRADNESEHGVQVAAVDFGARTGAVFYVPTGSAASPTTTVVWLSDDVSGGNE